MGRRGKCRVTFLPSNTLDGDGLPRGGETVDLFNSVTAFGAKNMQNFDTIYWVSVGVEAGTNTTGNSLTADFSSDGGTTWFNFYTAPTNEPVGDGGTFVAEIFVGQYEDIRVRFTNGASKQATFNVNVTLDSSERSTAGL